MEQLKCPDKGNNSFIYLLTLLIIVHLSNPCYVPDSLLNTSTTKLHVTVPAFEELTLLGKCGMQVTSWEVGNISYTIHCSL